MTVATEEARGIKEMLRALRSGDLELTAAEARFLVDAYYSAQEHRMRADGQVRALSAEPHELLRWLSAENASIENDVKKVLDVYSKRDPIGGWVREQKGAGPVIAAGLLAHIRFEVNGERVQTASRVWSFAGLNPAAKWEKKTKRPWNASLKTLCWKLGESFVKVHNQEGAFWGYLYAKRKATEVERNENGDFADQAAALLATKKYKESETKKSLEAGLLSKGHIHARAKRWAVKMFLSCFHRVGYAVTYGEECPKPYVISVLGHGDLIEPPGLVDYIAPYLKP